MTEKQMGINDDEWSKKIADGLKDVNAVMKSDQEAIDKITGIKDPPPAEKVPGTQSPAAMEVTLSGGHPMPGLDKPGVLKTLYPPATGEANDLMNPATFEHLQRVAKAFAASKILPEIYRNDVASCFVAVHMANRMQIDPFTFMQNSYVVQGKPALEGKLMIAVLNARGGYIDGIEYEYSGEGDDYGCRAFGTLRNGKVHEARVDIKLAKAEGWYAKNPKWKNMPDQMLAYRSAAFLLRKYRPELLMGLQTYEEVQDVDGVIVQSPVGGSYRRSDLNDSLDVG